MHAFMFKLNANAEFSAKKMSDETNFDCNIVELL